VSPRVYQAMARDGLFFRSFATLHPRFRTPVTAIVFQALVASALILTGSYGQLLDWVVFADWIFFGTTALTLVVFRRRDAVTGVADSGYRAPFYPLSVALFVLAALYVVFGSIASNPGNALRGVALLVAGPPSHSLIFFHKLSFFVWVGAMTVHVLGHLLELPKLALPDWRRRGGREAALAGAGMRIALLGTSLLAGLVLALATISVASPWLNG